MAMTKKNLYQRKRQHRVRFERHNGNVDAMGNPTYSVADDWNLLPQIWPCELLTASAGEVLRGRQVTAETSNVLIGEFFGAQGIEATDRVILSDGQRMAINGIMDQDGKQNEARIEARATL